MPGYARHTPELTENSAVRLVIADTALIPHISDAIAQLSLPYQWFEVGDSVAAVTDAMLEVVLAWYDTMLIGMVTQFLTLPPSGWLLLDGTTYDKDDYPELHAGLPSSLKTSTQFTLPDMTDSFMAGVQTVSGSGATGGNNSYQLTEGQLPAHTHTYTPPVADVDLEAPGAPDILAARLGTPTATGSTGDGDAIDNRPDFVTAQFAIYAGRV